MDLLPKIALFDDDMANLRMYHNNFKSHFHVTGYQNPFLFPEALACDNSAILVDVLMPVMDGIALYKELQAHPDYNGCPIIFISASGSDQVMLNALGTGGQDFLTRSMKKEEMITRIANKIDFFKANRQIYGLGNVKIHVCDYRAYCKGRLIELTLTELKIMKYLIREFPRLIPREDINCDVWPDQTVMSTTLNTHLSNLRNKFLEWEYEIQTIKSKGVELVLKLEVK